mgnify:CR=1 FL=1
MKCIAISHGASHSSVTRLARFASSPPPPLGARKRVRASCSNHAYFPTLQTQLLNQRRLVSVLVVVQSEPPILSAAPTVHGSSLRERQYVGRPGRQANDIFVHQNRYWGRVLHVRDVVVVRRVYVRRRVNFLGAHSELPLGAGAPGKNRADILSG